MITRSGAALEAALVRQISASKTIGAGQRFVCFTGFSFLESAVSLEK
jgi:hypothetical protein